MITLQQLEKEEFLENKLSKLSQEYQLIEKDLANIKMNCKHEIYVALSLIHPVSNPQYLLCHCLFCTQELPLYVGISNIGYEDEKTINVHKSFYKFHNNEFKLQIVRELYKQIITDNPCISIEEIISLMRTHLNVQKKDNYSSDVKRIIEKEKKKYTIL